LFARLAIHEPTLIGLIDDDPMCDQSPTFFAVILEKLAAALPHARHHVYRGAGHVPHLTHPDEFVQVVTRLAT
jgi:pimeloyl-ACP methyl ester carboxylesterase